MEVEFRLEFIGLVLKVKISTPFLLTLLVSLWYFLLLPLSRQQAVVGEVVAVWQDFRDDYLYGIAYDVHRKAGTAATGIVGLASIRYLYELARRLFQAAQ